jgi:3-hydroxybutyryl-CoA dehydrogenase
MRTIAIIGAGLMGREVAWASLRAGYEVRLYDVNPESLLSAVTELREQLAELPAIPLTACETLADAVNAAELTFENVSEDLNLKRRVHAEIEAALPADAIQGSNSSALRGSDIAAGLKHPERLFNANFDHPRSGGKLVEIMGHVATSAETLAIASTWIQRMGLISIPVKRESLGYVQNRIWRAIKREAMRLVDGGHSTVEDVDKGFCLSYGVSVGPFALMDKVGLQTVLKIEEIYFAASGAEEDRPTELLRRLVQEGKTGINAGEGFYKYPQRKK